MGGALRNKSGSMLKGGRMAGDPHVGGGRASRRLVAKGVAKALAKHPCGSCSVCCTSMGVEEIEKPEGVPCPAIRETGSGCKIYAKRPLSCATYNCLYRVGLLDKTSVPYGRPDSLGIIFDVNNTHATGIQMVVAREVVPGALEANMALLHELAGQGHVLYLIDGDRRRMMGPEEKVRAVQLAAKRSLPIVSR